jgi:broad specificity phosphatase PhoE
MTRLFLIRHGAPASAWGEADPDPGLSPRGIAQATAAAEALAVLGARAAVSSPMRRCRETAAAFDQGGVAIDARVSEVRAPAGAGDRRAWLRDNFPWREGERARGWVDLDPALHAWRSDLLQALSEFADGSAVFTHFIAINAIVGTALAAEQTIVCRPDHASITEIEVRGDALSLIRLGVEMQAGEVL